MRKSCRECNRMVRIDPDRKKVTCRYFVAHRGTVSAREVLRPLPEAGCWDWVPYREKLFRQEAHLLPQ